MVKTEDAGAIRESVGGFIESPISYKNDNITILIL